MEGGGGGGGGGGREGGGGAFNGRGPVFPALVGYHRSTLWMRSCTPFAILSIRIRVVARAGVCVRACVMPQPTYRLVCRDT